MLQDHSTVYKTVHNLCISVSYEHMYKILSYYNVPKLRYGHFTPFVKRLPYYKSHNYSSVTILIIIVYAIIRIKHAEFLLPSTF